MTVGQGDATLCEPPNSGYTNAMVAADSRLAPPHALLASRQSSLHFDAPRIVVCYAIDVRAHRLGQ